MKTKNKAIYRRMRTASAFLTLLMFILASVGSVSAKTGGGDRIKLSADLPTQNSFVSVIVQFKKMPTPAQYNTFSHQGANLQHEFSGIRAVHMRIPASMISVLQKDANVLYITPDRPVQMSNDNENYEAAVMADVAYQQYGLDGTGVGVAVIDSGVTDNVDLHNASGASRIVYSQSFVAGDSTTADGYGHGTHVAGIIAGNGTAANGKNYALKMAGMAPGVNIVNLRVLDGTGTGTDSQVIAAIQRAIQLRSTYNIRVINLSLGRQVFESYTLDPLCQAVEQAWQAGMVVVVAAGNSGRDNSHGTRGYATIGAPGNDPSVVTVGATRTMNTASRADDAIASYSSKGPTLIDHIVKPDVVAPGNRIASILVKGSTLDTEYPDLEVGPVCTTACPSPSYFRLSGTSMATPVVTGAVALMLEKDSTLTPDTVKARMMKTAWKGFGLYSKAFDVYNNEYDDQYDLFVYGAGYLDVDAVLGSTDVANAAALSPTAYLDPTTGYIRIENTNSPLFGNSVVWGSSVVWGNTVVWGNCIDANSVVWGNTVVWGNSLETGYSVVWGASVVWGNSLTAFSVDQDGEN